jgi:hypothetical protein
MTSANKKSCAMFAYMRSASPVSRSWHLSEAAQTRIVAADSSAVTAVSSDGLGFKNGSAAAKNRQLIATWRRRWSHGVRLQNVDDPDNEALLGFGQRLQPFPWRMARGDRRLFEARAGLVMPIRSSTGTLNTRDSLPKTNTEMRRPPNSYANTAC